MTNPFKAISMNRCLSALPRRCRSNAPSQNAAMLARILLVSLVGACPLAAFAQSTSSSSPQSTAEPKTPSQVQPATLDPPPQKEDSLAETARKAKAKKPPAAKGKVYTEDDLSGMKGPGVSVVGEAPRKGARRGQPSNPDEDPANSEQYWRGRARQILDAIAQTDDQITQKKDEIKKFGSGGFDVTTGMKDNIAYIHDRNAQLKELENRKADLQKQLDELQDEGRQAGAPASWFR
jgi:hypothetical protein